MKLKLDPAAGLGLIQAALAMLLSLNLFGLTDEAIGLIMGVLTAAVGVYTAYVTRDTMLGVILALAKAIFAFVIGFGYELSPDTAAAVIAVITILVGFFQRTQTAPLLVPSFNNPPDAPVLTAPVPVVVKSTGPETRFPPNGPTGHV